MISTVCYCLFGEIFCLLVGRNNIVLSASRSQFDITGPGKCLKIVQHIKFLWPKWILNRAFPLDRITKGDNNFPAKISNINYLNMNTRHHKMTQNTYLRSN